MKRLAIAICFLLLALSVQARGIREESDLVHEQARISYAFGMTVGGDLQQTGLAIEYAAFAEGFKAAMEQENTKLDRDEALELVQNAFERALLKRYAQLRDDEITFLAENAAGKGVTVTESGLQYVVLQEGSGPKPGPNDTVIVHYEGALVDGTVFDSSYPQGQPEEIPLDMVIPGWAEGIQLMSMGGKYLFYIPSNLAYGEYGAGQFIPPYSTLVFTVELIDIIDGQEPDEES
ncbi:MAG: FKBP-type peptidyl-prolyl cis-trans isomerase [Treponema sp.]|nr:FKBP-type peptidyl-prolyl cis-trans isomerase [Treponema sp.]